MKGTSMLVRLLSSAVLLALSNSVMAADEWTKAKLVDNIHVISSGTYYFESLEGWGAPGCPNAAFIFYRKHETPASEAMLSVILASQATNRPIKVQGFCQDSNHFKFRYLVQDKAQ